MTVEARRKWYVPGRSCAMNKGRNDDEAQHLSLCSQTSCAVGAVTLCSCFVTCVVCTSCLLENSDAPRPKYQPQHTSRLRKQHTVKRRHMSTMASIAATAVFNLIELLKMILLQLPPNDLILAIGTYDEGNDIMFPSTAIQKHVLEASSSAP